MKKFNPPHVSGGSWVDSQGVPNARAVTQIALGVMTQLNGLADDIDWIKAHLPKTGASAPNLTPVASSQQLAGTSMKKLNPPNISGGSWIDSNGDPNARAAAHVVVGLMAQLNSLVDDIDWIRAHLPKTQASAPNLTSVASLSRPAKSFVLPVR